MTSEIPYYLRVADQLELEIAALAVGEPMPSEHELARDHEINRLTARAALDELQRRYLVRRQQGKRTVVARRIEFRLTAKGVPGWSKTVAKAGASPRTEVDLLRLRQPPVDIRAMLKLSKKDQALQLGRRRFVNDELGAYSLSWLNTTVANGLEEHSTAGQLKSALRQSHVKLKRTLRRCHLVVAPRDLAQRFDSYGRPLVFELVTQLTSGKRRFGITTTWMRADMFDVVFDMDFAARNE